MQIDDRLQALAELVPEHCRAADIGTDHGYVPIYLAEIGKIKSALAMDVRKALAANDTLGDMIQHGAVTKMQFGAVTGRAGACLITYKAKVWM